MLLLVQENDEDAAGKTEVACQFWFVAHTNRSGVAGESYGSEDKMRAIGKTLHEHRRVPKMYIMKFVAQILWNNRSINVIFEAILISYRSRDLLTKNKFLALIR